MDGDMHLRNADVGFGYTAGKIFPEMAEDSGWEVQVNLLGVECGGTDEPSGSWLAIGSRAWAWG
jgi:hypothetical protein